jgi:GR25 family glycosyltransferase involved in LPS biosynthesis
MPTTYRLHPDWAVSCKDAFKTLVLGDAFIARSKWREDNTIRTQRQNLHMFHGRPLRKGEVGCSISHHQVWSKALLDDMDYTLVLEDDVKPPDEKKVKALCNILSMLNNDNCTFDILYLFSFDEACSGVPKCDTAGSFTRTFTVDRKPWHVKDSVYGLASTAAYVLSKAGAKTLLSSNFATAIINVDDFLNLQILPEEDVHRPDLVRQLWPEGRSRLKALFFTKNFLEVHTDWDSTIVQGEY